MKPFRSVWIPSAAALAVGAVLLAFASPSTLRADASAPAGVHVKGASPLHISHGEEVNLPDYFVPGKMMIFDFYSEYCPPCRAIGPYLEKLHAAHPDMDVVKIDINRPGHEGIDWGSPVARQYSLTSIPHFVIVGPDGKKISEGDAAYQRVIDWVNALPQAPGV